MTGNGMEFKIATTYGGAFGRLARMLGLRWNHIIIVQFSDGQPVTTYESNTLRGVHQHPFRADPDLAWEHQWYEAVEPFTETEAVCFGWYCDGMCGKAYALHYWPLLLWRVITNLLTKPSRALLVPAETCITFVNEACAAVGRPVTVHGSRGLPDDIMSSPHWERVGDDRREEH